MREISYSFDFMDKDKINTSVVVYNDGSVEYENFTDDFMEKAFGNRKNVDFMDVHDFFARRCMPPNRDKIDVILKSVGLNRYDPKAIVEKTYGLKIEDTNWVRFKGVNKSYDEVHYEVYGDSLKRV